ncbi:hypothetical protein [Psychroserpens sp. NJDZ02]|uniref:hypothetical protein n=1 Tax=Psychroserpens sp. NJDZ02 TaxID=2570561 RepID=UPI0026933814
MSPKLFIAGDKNDHKLLGGPYLRIGKEIFWHGQKLENVDYKSFKTILVGKNKSEWDVTMGKDNEIFFKGNRIIKNN